LTAVLFQSFEISIVWQQLIDKAIRSNHMVEQMDNFLVIHAHKGADVSAENHQSSQSSLAVSNQVGGEGMQARQKPGTGYSLPQLSLVDRSESVAAASGSQPNSESAIASVGKSFVEHEKQLIKDIKDGKATTAEKAEAVAQGVVVVAGAMAAGAAIVGAIGVEAVGGILAAVTAGGVAVSASEKTSATNHNHKPNPRDEA
jgi:hypothetical protein